MLTSNKTSKAGNEEFCTARAELYLRKEKFATSCCKELRALTGISSLPPVSFLLHHLPMSTTPHWYNDRDASDGFSRTCSTGCGVLETSPRGSSPVLSGAKGEGVFFSFYACYCPYPSQSVRGSFLLFPGYLFVRIHKPVEYLIVDVCCSGGVYGWSNSTVTPAPLDEEVVEFLRRRVTPAGIIIMKSLRL